MLAKLKVAILLQSGVNYASWFFCHHAGKVTPVVSDLAALLATEAAGPNIDPTLQAPPVVSYAGAPSTCH